MRAKYAYGHTYTRSVNACTYIFCTIYLYAGIPDSVLFPAFRFVSLFPFFPPSALAAQQSCERICRRDKQREKHRAKVSTAHALFFCTLLSLAPLQSFNPLPDNDSSEDISTSRLAVFNLLSNYYLNFYVIIVKSL